MEILAERIPKTQMAEKGRLSNSKELFEKGIKMPEQDNQWQFLLWESIRLYPTKENLETYLNFLQEKKYLEYDYYSKLYEGLEEC